MSHKPEKRTRFSYARRFFILTSGAAALSLNDTRCALSKQSDDEPISQPATPNRAAFIERAFEMRRLAVQLGDQPYGAIIVNNGKIIGQSWSRVVLDNDPTGHAEMAAIRDAARRTKTRNLSGATIYSSSRPCPMCEAAAYWAGIGHMLYGRSIADAGTPRLCR